MTHCEQSIPPHKKIVMKYCEGFEVLCLNGNDLVSLCHLGGKGFAPASHSRRKAKTGGKVTISVDMHAGFVFDTVTFAVQCFILLWTCLVQECFLSVGKSCAVFQYTGSNKISCFFGPSQKWFSFQKKIIKYALGGKGIFSFILMLIWSFVEKIPAFG